MVTHPYSTCERTLLPESLPSQVRLRLRQTLTGVLKRILPLPFRRTTNDVPIITTKLFPKNHRPCGKFDVCRRVMWAPETRFAIVCYKDSSGREKSPAIPAPTDPRVQAPPRRRLDKQSRLVIENLSRSELWRVGILC